MSLTVVDGGAHVFSRAKLTGKGEVKDPVLLAALRQALVELRAAADG